MLKTFILIPAALAALAVSLPHDFDLSLETAAGASRRSSIRLPASPSGFEK